MALTPVFTGYYKEKKTKKERKRGGG